MQSPITSQWISANAGSGKTYALTREVVKLLLLGVPAERICCITYTKAAAGEMRQRVIGLLRGLLLADEAECLNQVAALVGMPPTETMLARARMLFGQVLDSPTGGIQLTTIHGFCQQILRAFPLEAGVAPHFTVADEAQTAQLIAQVKHRLLSSPMAVHGALAEAIATLAQRSGEMRFDTLVKTLLAQRERWRDAWAGQTEEVYAQRLRTLLFHGLDAATGEGTPGLSDEDAGLCRAHLHALSQHKNQRERALAENLAAWCRGDIAPDAWLQIWLTQQFEPRKTLLNAKEFPEHHPLTQFVARCCMRAQQLVAQRAAEALFDESYAVALLARALIDLYDQVKAERGLLDYPDLITRTRQLLTTPAMVGWVMSKLDHRIDHLLVDEAQDTSSEQWQIAQVLVDELVATTGGLGSTNLPRSLFVVGDEKQSIFSFQGAAPALYAAKRGAFDALLQATPAPLVSRELTHSYRSAPAILTVVDAVAHLPEVAPALSAIGMPQNHAATRATAGSVVLHAPLTPEEKVSPEPFVIPTEYSITRSGAQQLGEQVAAQVKRWIDDGAWNAGDVLILTRNRQPLVLPLLRALQRLGIPVAGIDRLVLADHLAVKDLLALMRWIVSPHDDLALAQVLRSPLIGSSEEDLYELAHAREAATLWEAVHASAPAIGDTLQQWRNLAQCTPYDFLTRVLDVDGTRRQFARRFGEEVHEIFDELKEQAAAMPRGMAPTLTNLAQWIGGSDRQIKRELESGEADQVRVMTVHGAKGLEAKLVVLIDTVSTPNLTKELLSETTDAHGQTFPLLAFSDDARRAPAWREGRSRQQQAQLAEYYRLLYVAMTRPRDALHVFAMAPARGTMPEGCWYDMMRRGLAALPVTTNNDGGVIYQDAEFLPKAKTRVTPASTPLPSWVRETPMAVAAVPTLNPSRLQPEALAPFQVARGAGTRQRGVRLHRVLQYMTAETTDADLAALLGTIAPDWTMTQRAQAATELAALRREHGWLWAHPARAEVHISGALEIGGVRYPVFGQIDRLVEAPDFIAVLDYKTGSDVPAEPAQTGSGYVLQMKLYKALLETLYPGKPVRTGIVWTANARLDWLDAVVDAALWPPLSLDAA